MTILLVGAGILGSVLGLFYLKDRLKSRTLARIVYSGLTMRFAVIGALMIVVGAMLALSTLLS